MTHPTYPTYTVVEAGGDTYTRLPDGQWCVPGERGEDIGFDDDEQLWQRFPDHRVVAWPLGEPFIAATHQALPAAPAPGFPIQRGQEPPAVHEDNVCSRCAADCHDACGDYLGGIRCVCAKHGHNVTIVGS
ncbi:MAG: hypothetical protein ACRDXE_10565 [Acidimicrobiales bacterium]